MVPLERLVNHCDMELMKMAMLRHEETFRQQVHELHRLYRVQRQLMSGLTTGPSSELIISRRRRFRRRRQPRRALDPRRPAGERVVAVVAPPAPRDEDGLELTLAVGGRRKRRDGGPLASSDCSRGSLTSLSSTDTTTTSSGGSPPYQRAAPASRLQKGAAMQPWLVQCLSLKMA